MICLDHFQRITSSKLRAKMIYLCSIHVQSMFNPRRLWTPWLCYSFSALLNENIFTWTLFLFYKYTCYICKDDIVILEFLISRFTYICNLYRGLLNMSLWDDCLSVNHTWISNQLHGLFFNSCYTFWCFHCRQKIRCETCANNDERNIHNQSLYNVGLDKFIEYNTKCQQGGTMWRECSRQGLQQEDSNSHPVHHYHNRHYRRSVSVRMDVEQSTFEIEGEQLVTSEQFHTEFDCGGSDGDVISGLTSAYMGVPGQ